MSEPSEEWWARARRARDRLVERIIGHPGVSMVDIGADPRGASTTPVLRVHVYAPGAPLPELPASVDGIPVRTIHGDYQLQRGADEQR